MLQIISGKFYGNGERSKFECKGVFYSNYKWLSPISTCIGTIDPVVSASSISSYVFSYVNQLELSKSAGSTRLVRTGDKDIMKQITLLASFALKAYLHSEKENVESICSEQSNSTYYSRPGTDYVQRFLDSQIYGTQFEINKLQQFLSQVIGLRRTTYRTVLSCISAFYTSLENLQQDINLAYSIMIYSLETLSQNFDQYEPSWEDYQPERRNAIDKILTTFPLPIAQEFRDILVKDEHLKLSKRFIDFAIGHISDSFYCDEAEKVTNAIKKSELQRLLKNAYKNRSLYVHKLEPLPKPIEHGILSTDEVFYDDNEPYLTYSGLCRLTHHIIYNFIMIQQTFEKETYNWTDELPGTLVLNLAPKYWVGVVNSEITNLAIRRLADFLTHLIENNSVLDIREVLKKYEELFPQTNSIKKKYMFVTYFLYTHFAPTAFIPDNCDAFIKNNSYLLDTCSIENMLPPLFLDQDFKWDCHSCSLVIIDYMKKRYSANALSLPHKVEIALYIKLANTYLASNDVSNFGLWIDNAIFDCAGYFGLQQQLIAVKTNKKSFDYNLILFSAEPTQTPVEVPDYFL